MAREEATVDYAKRAAKLVEIRDPDGGPPHEPSTWIFDHWIDTCEDPRVTAARLREKIAAELQAAHDAGVAEGKRRCREATQAIIEGVGASGPMSLEEAVAKVIARLQDRNAEVAALRQIISDAAYETGGRMAPECSLEFMALLPREIALALRRAEGGR